MKKFQLCFLRAEESLIEIEAESREEAWEIGRSMQTSSVALASVAAVPCLPEDSEWLKSVYRNQ